MSRRTVGWAIRRFGAQSAPGRRRCKYKDLEARLSLWVSDPVGLERVGGGGR